MDILLFLFLPKKFIKKAVTKIIASEFRTNSQLRAAFPDEKLPLDKYKEFEEGEVERVSSLRGSLLKSFFTCLATLILAFFTSYLLRINSIHISNGLWVSIQCFSAFLFLWATLGKIGWEIQTYSGDTPSERINNLFYRWCFIIGSYGIFMSLFITSK